MSNKRIDLTRFEGIGDEKHFLFIEKTQTDGFHWSVFFENNVEASMSVSCEFGLEIREEADRFYHAIDALPKILAELKRMYERENALVSAIKELCDSEDSTGCSGDLTVVSLDPMLKLYELTSYSAYR